jgi:hypothetical protein
MQLHATRRQWVVHTAAALVPAFGAASAHALTPAPRPDRPEVKPQVGNPSRVLFVGNSYFYYNDSLHNIVRGLLGAGEDGAAGAPGAPSAPGAQRLQFKSATIGGSSLSHHNIDWLTTPGRIGVAQPFEWVVLQGNSADALSEAGQAEFRSAVGAANTVIRGRNARVALYMVHAYVPPHRQARAENIRKIERFYTEVGNEVGALVIPVGLAFERWLAANPSEPLHQSYDGSHPNWAGSYLAGCVVLACLYGKSPVGNSFDAHGKVSAHQRERLQVCAAETVAAYFNSLAHLKPM